jgi:hypothetical protein
MEHWCHDTDGGKVKYSGVCYNKQFLSIKLGCYNKCGGILLFMLFTYVRLFMLFKFTG